ncbi:MAG: Stp1/IreP family PP2C-type Ser/Thr phosphatase [Polyangiaceae bacterium]
MTDSTAPEKKKSGTIRLRVFGQTAVGQVREHNEDNFLIADLTRKSREFSSGQLYQVGRCGAVFGVCDGMGGAAAGEVASRFGVDIIYNQLVSAGAPRGREDLARRLVNAIQDAGHRIFSEARADRTRRGMGTTATVAAFLDDRLFIAQVGDSRAYVLRNGDLVQVTRDQSLVNQLIEAGQLTEEEAETFEHNNIILQALGTSETVQVDLTYVDLRSSDTLLLCSDGLSSMVRGEEIRDTLLGVNDPHEACQALIDKANEAGGHDNVTVVVVKFGGSGLHEPAPEDETLAYRKYAFSASEESPELAASLRDTSVEGTRHGAGPAEDGELGPVDSDTFDPPSPESFQRRQVDEASEEAAPEAAVAPSQGVPPAFAGLILLVVFLAIVVVGFFFLS